jgi:hypothetical protein
VDFKSQSTGPCSGNGDLNLKTLPIRLQIWHLFTDAAAESTNDKQKTFLLYLYPLVVAIPTLKVNYFFHDWLIHSEKE